MARARAIAAKLGKAGVSVPSTSTPPVNPAAANLPPKPTIVSNSSNGASNDAVVAALPDKDEISRRVAEARRLVANANTQAALSSNPYIVSWLFHVLYSSLIAPPSSRHQHKGRKKHWLHLKLPFHKVQV
jgi:predicted acylesterase/phospholipase RssA